MSENPSKSSKTDITPEDIRGAMRVVAKLIRYQGDEFWPLMERLKRELQEMKDRAKLLAELLN